MPITPYFRLLSFALLLLLTTTACKQDSTSAGAADATDSAASTTDLPPVINNTPPPSVELPYSCTVLHKELVREIFDYGEDQALIPVHGQALGSCYYQLTTEDWTADLVLEPFKEADQAALDADIAAATGTDRTTLAGHPARWHNDGRILSVAAPQPFAVKLSILPRGQYGKVVEGDERRALIVAVAEAVVGKL
ncbi:MAG: hypothetical protein AAF433_07295 [Bacteroidota bacterium]